MSVFACMLDIVLTRALDLSLDWIPNTFNALTPPSGEVSLTAADFSDPNLFCGLDFTNYAVGATSFSDTIWTPLSASSSTPSSPRSVVESLSGSDSSLESLQPVAGNHIAPSGDLNVVPFEWESLATFGPAVAAKMPQNSAQEKVDFRDTLLDFNIFDAPSQDPLTGLSFGDDLFALSYGDWSAPQLVL